MPVFLKYQKIDPCFQHLNLAVNPRLCRKKTLKEAINLKGICARIVEFLL